MKAFFLAFHNKIHGDAKVGRYNSNTGIQVDWLQIPKKNGAIEVGGGSPKNFFMQTQPTLWQILYQEKGGHDYFIQLTVDSPQWGGLSGATPQEAKSWGKVKEADINNVVVYSCASLTFPILCQYVEESCTKKKLKELYLKKKDFTDELIKTGRQTEKIKKLYESA